MPASVGEGPDGGVEAGSYIIKGADGLMVARLPVKVSSVRVVAVSIGLEVEWCTLRELVEYCVC